VTAAGRHRPRGWVRHYAGLLGPDAGEGMREVLGRDARQRLGQAASASAARAWQRRRPTRERMRALRAAPGGRLRWQEVPVPGPPVPDAAVVRPIAASTCDIDRMIALGSGQFALPLHLGHECVAEVLAVGERVQSVARGDRVVVPFQISCGACAPCREGRTGSCAGVPPVSMYGMGLIGGAWGGAFAEQLCVPFADAMLVPLPAGVDPVAAASVADNLCDAYRHIAPHLPALLERDPDSEVLVLAAGSQRLPFSPSAPLFTALIARAFGARSVRLADARPHVRARAEALGVEALHPRQLRRMAPVALVADISVDNLRSALLSTAADGICSSSGSFHRSVRIPALRMYIRNVTLHFGRTHARALMPQVLEMLAAGTLDPRPIVTTVASLQDAPAAIGQHVRSDDVKTVLVA